MHLPYGWQNMTASALNDYLATHSQAEIKAANDQQLNDALRNNAQQQPTTNVPPHNETPMEPITMNGLGLFGDGVQHAGGGRLLEAPTQPAAAPMYYGASGGAMAPVNESAPVEETPYEAPDLWGDWGQRLNAIDKASQPARNQAAYERGPGVPADETPYVAPTMDFGND